MSDRFQAVTAAVHDLAEGWCAERPERLARQALDPSDFAALHEAGYTATGVPASRMMLKSASANSVW